MNSRLNFFRQGMKDGIPVCLGYIAVSFTFGIAAKNAGLNAFQAVLMSSTNFTSAGQFAALSIISAGAGYLEMAVTQFIINLRYFLMSCALSQKLRPKDSFFHRFLIAFGNSDEVFGLSVSVKGLLSPFYTYGIMAVAVPGWASGTFLGVIAGNILPARVVSALGISLYGMFIAVIVPPAKKSRIIAGVVVVSMMVSLIFSLIPVLRDISSGFRIIILTILIAGGVAVLFPVKEDSDED